MQWIYSILLDVRISNCFSNGGERNVRSNLTEGPTYVYTLEDPMKVTFAIFVGL